MYTYNITLSDRVSGERQGLEGGMILLLLLLLLIIIIIIIIVRITVLLR